jgi:GNAT superfamily N-acetyltransferase
MLGPGDHGREELSVRPDHELVIRSAGVADVDRVCAFGETHIRPHYTPIIGARAADQQVATWWNRAQILSAAAESRLVLAEAHGTVVGVAQHGRHGADVVLYKLYLDPRYRGQGLGPRLIAAVIDALPPEVGRLCVEHIAGNVRAAAFYEREGFTVERVERGAPGGSGIDVVWRARAVGDTPETRSPRRSTPRGSGRR